MSFQAMAWACRTKVGNATGKAVLMMLANYADGNGECFPSQKRLAKDCECSVKTITRWLKLFEEEGLLTRKAQRREDGYRRSDRFYLTVPALKKPETNQTDEDVASAENKSPYRASGEDKSPKSRQKVLAEPITHPPTSSLRSEGSSFKREHSQKEKFYSESFCLFWQIWREAGGGGDKAPAHQAFKTLSKLSQREASAAAPHWLAKWRRETPGANAIHASTYLREKRFDGVIDGPRLAARQPAAPRGSQVTHNTHGTAFSAAASSVLRQAAEEGSSL